MKKHLLWIAPVLMMVALPVWAHCGKCGKGAAKSTGGDAHAHQHAHAELGKSAPDFTLTDVNGNEHKLSSYAGKVVVLEWTNHTCPFVMRHQADKKTMQKTLAHFKGKPVVWLAINSSHFSAEKSDDIKKWIESNKIEYPILLDPKGEVGHTYGAKTTPHMYVIDQKGVLAYTGAIDDDQYGNQENPRNYVREAVEALLNGSEIPVKRTQSYGCSVKYKK